MALNRRDILISGVVLLAVFGLPPAYRRFFPSFEFIPISGLNGFRQLGMGQVSLGPIAFLGLDSTNEDLSAQQDEILSSPCRSFFGATGWSSEKLPIAVFTDYNCPYCAIFSERLIRLEESGAPVRLIWNELPLLGPRSERSANAALAAARQGKYIAAHRHLMRKVLRPGPTGLRQMAKALDLDADRLIADAGGADVAAELRKVRAMASVLGVIGTPSTLVGRTLVVGSITDTGLNNLIRLEQSEPFAACT